MCGKAGDYFVIIVLMIFFLILYVTFDPFAFRNKKEAYRNMYADAYPSLSSPEIQSNLPVFMTPHTTEIYQGLSVPLKYKPSKIDMTDKTLPSVDGKENSPNSMFMFAYNRCSPECCKDSPYSCSGGCVCMSNDQLNYIDSRGKNREVNKCLFDSNGYA